MRIALGALLLVALMSVASGTALAAAKPPATPTDTPTATSTPTATATATLTVTSTPTASPTATAPTGAYSGTVPLGSNDQGPGWNFGIFSLHWFDFFGSIASGVVGWLLGGVNAIVDGFTAILTAIVRVDRWPLLAAFFTFLLAVAGGAAGALCILGALRYYRSLLPGGSALDGAAGLAMLTRTLETAALLLGLGWGIGQLLDFLQAIGDAIAGYNAIDGAGLLTSMVAVLIGQAANPIGALVGIVAAIVYALILLVKIGSVAVLAWLFVVSPLCAATWTLGSGIMAGWLRSFVSVGLWGAAWGVWLKIATEVLADYTLPPIFKPPLVLGLLLMGYGVPRMVDQLLQTNMARVGGAFNLSGAAISGAMTAAGPTLRAGGDAALTIAKRAIK